MSVVSVKFNKFSLYPEILIDGEAISRYMTLTNYIYNDLFLWTDLFFEVMDSELADSYAVEITGHPYHCIAFSAAKESSEYCDKIVFHELEFPVPVLEKYRFVQQMNNEYGVLTSNMYDCVDLNYTSLPDFDEEAYTDAVFNERESDFFIAGSAEGDLPAKYTIVIADADRIVKQKSGAVIYVTKEHLQCLIDYLNIYHLRLKGVVDFVAASSRFSFEKEQKTELDSYVNEKINAIVSPLPVEIDLGTSFDISVKLYPGSTPLSYVHVEISDWSVLGCSGLTITGSNTGSCVLTVKGQDGEIFASSQIRVIKHNYVTNIAIVLPSLSVKVGETMNFRVIATPENAEDIGDVKVTASNEKTAIISGSYELYALSAGRVKVTAETKNVKRSAYISVIPEVAGLLLPVENLDLPINAVATLGCSYYPGDASPKPVIEWVSSNPKLVSVTKRGEFGCTLTSGGQRGTVTITCKMANSSIFKSFNVFVK